MKQVNYLIGDGKSHWLEGVLLIMMYVIIALAAWYVSSPYIPRGRTNRRQVLPQQDGRDAGEWMKIHIVLNCQYTRSSCR